MWVRKIFRCTFSGVWLTLLRTPRILKSVISLRPLQDTRTDAFSTMCCKAYSWKPGWGHEGIKGGQTLKTGTGTWIQKSWGQVGHAHPGGALIPATVLTSALLLYAQGEELAEPCRRSLWMSSLDLNTLEEKAVVATFCTH